jgi:hypothetical protein
MKRNASVLLALFAGGFVLGYFVVDLITDKMP